MAKRVAVVTGSNKGVGLGIVRALCKQFEGDVFLTSRTESLGQEAVQALEKEGLTPKYHQLDITDHASITRLRDFLQQNYGGLDLLVNNAGIAFTAQSTTPFSEQAKILLKTNFFGTLDACEVLFPLLRPHARVVNVASYFALATLSKCSPEKQERFTSRDITMDELVKTVNLFVESAQTGDHIKQGFPEFAYGMSKLAILVMTRIQQRELDSKGAEDIIVNAALSLRCMQHFYHPTQKVPEESFYKRRKFLSGNHLRPNESPSKQVFKVKYLFTKNTYFASNDCQS